MPEINVKNELRKLSNRLSKDVLHRTSWQIRPGMNLLLGTTKSGKTRALAGLLQETDGSNLKVALCVSMADYFADSRLHGSDASVFAALDKVYQDLAEYDLFLIDDVDRLIEMNLPSQNPGTFNIADALQKWLKAAHDLAAVRGVCVLASVNADREMMGLDRSRFPYPVYKLK